MDTSKVERIEVIPGKLVYMSVPNDFVPEKRHDHDIFFCTDTSLVYTAFFADFGPLDLGLTYKFMQECEKNLKRLGYYPQQPGAAESESSGGGTVTYYSSNHAHRRANSIALLMAFCIFVWGYDVEQAYSPFYDIAPSVITFRDAAFCINSFPLTILDVCMALYKVHINRHFVYKDFNLTAFQSLNKLQNGDLTWIVPGKFLAFSGPVAKRRLLSAGLYSLRPEEYVPILKQLGVSCIVRFNSKCYDRNVFVNAGIRHVDLYYEDGANPTDCILNSFLQLCEGEKGAIAVHCKAGLGRTGTNIAAYMIKHYHYTARETIAWSRICRPGCVVGPQQQYLMSVEARLQEDGQRWRQKRGINSPFPSYAHAAAAPTGVIPVLCKSNSMRSENSSGGGSGGGGAPGDGSALAARLLKIKSNSSSNMGARDRDRDRDHEHEHIDYVQGSAVATRPSTSAGLGGGGVGEPARYRSGQERVSSAKVATRNNNFMGSEEHATSGGAARMPLLVQSSGGGGAVQAGGSTGTVRQSGGGGGAQLVSSSRDGALRGSNGGQGSYTDSAGRGSQPLYSAPANRPNTSAGIIRGNSATATRSSTGGQSSNSGYAADVSSRNGAAATAGTGSNGAGGNKYALQTGSGLGLVGRSAGTIGYSSSSSGHGIRKAATGGARKYH